MSVPDAIMSYYRPDPCKNESGSKDFFCIVFIFLCKGEEYRQQALYKLPRRTQG